MIINHEITKFQNEFGLQNGETNKNCSENSYAQSQAPHCSSFFLSFFLSCHSSVFIFLYHGICLDLPSMNKKENEVVFTGKIVEVSESEKLYNIKLYIHVFLTLLIRGRYNNGNIIFYILF
ncbi:hypothetical protein YC2023_008664 [Brassica napus]